MSKFTPTPTDEVCKHWAKPCVYCSNEFKNLKSSHAALLEAAKEFMEFHGHAHAFECNLTKDTCTCGTDKLHEKLKKAIQSTEYLSTISEENE